MLAAEKDAKKIVVEIKSFINPSFFTAFYEAVGKFVSYKDALEHREPERKLYLGVPQLTFETNFNEIIVQSVVQKLEIQIVVYNPDDETIIKWIK